MQRSPPQAAGQLAARDLALVSYTIYRKYRDCTLVALPDLHIPANLTVHNRIRILLWTQAQSRKAADLFLDSLLRALILNK